MSSSRRAKDTNDEEISEPWKEPREHHHLDHGSFAALVDQLVEESKSTHVDLTGAENLLQLIRSSIDTNLPDYDLAVQAKDNAGDEAYWKQKAGQAEDYLRDVVYGGPEGVAYVRSLAAFVHHEGPKPPRDHSVSDPLDGLGMSLADWVVDNVVDPLTDGRHRLLRETASHLETPQADYTEVSELVDRSLRLLPQAAQDLVALKAMSGTLLDMASLIRKPDELFIADDVWAGASYMEEQRRQREEEREKALVESPAKNAAEYLAFAIQSHKEAESPRPKPAFEGPDVLLHALDWSADVIEEFAGRKKRPFDAMDVDDDEKANEEEPRMRKFRLNLLALSKRAPLEKVARLPAELVPMHIRHVIPTLESAR